MAKRKRDGRQAGKKSGRKGPASRRTPRRAKATARPSRKSPKRAVTRARKKAPTAKTRSVLKAGRRIAQATTTRKLKSALSSKTRTAPPAAARAPHAPPSRLARPRRVLDDRTVPTPPSSLNMDRHGSAVRTGRAEMAEHLADHATLTPAITAGDVDVNIEDAYFSGDEAPGGDNPTPDQDVVDDIGKALGIEYQDNEELQSGDKVSERDKHRWELDPASSEDYGERKK